MICPNKWASDSVTCSVRALIHSGSLLFQESNRMSWSKEMKIIRWYNHSGAWKPKWIFVFERNELTGLSHSIPVTAQAIAIAQTIAPTETIAVAQTVITTPVSHCICLIDWVEYVSIQILNDFLKMVELYLYSKSSQKNQLALGFCFGY